MNDAFVERLEWFKANEKPEVVLLIADDRPKTKILIAWTNTTVRQRGNSSAPEGTDANEIWRWLWNQAEFDRDELREKSAVYDPYFDGRLQFLIGNRVIYPDGTINSFVQRYLRDRVLKLFEAKPARSTKPKTA
jgi:hypothetical protein